MPLDLPLRAKWLLLRGSHILEKFIRLRLTYECGRGRNFIELGLYK